MCRFVTAILISLISERIGSVQTSGSIFLAVNCYAAFFLKRLNELWLAFKICDLTYKDYYRLQINALGLYYSFHWIQHTYFCSTQEIPDIKEVSFKMSRSFFKDFGWSKWCGPLSPETLVVQLSKIQFHVLIKKRKRKKHPTKSHTPKKPQPPQSKPIWQLLGDWDLLGMSSLMGQGQMILLRAIWKGLGFNMLEL